MSVVALLKVFRLLMLFSVSLANPTRISSDGVTKQLLVELRSQQMSTGTCAGAGYTNGCCIGGFQCKVTTGSTQCYCDKYCHYFNDCCTDIEFIGCLPDTCFLARLEPGCCRWSPGQSCYVRGGRCFCDRFCRLFNDCCEDVNLGEIEPCTEPTTTIIPEITTTMETITTPMETTTPTTVTMEPPAPTPGCLSQFNQTNGCCTGNQVQCGIIGVDNVLCHCDVGCYAYNTCCSDIQEISCFPRNCADVGKLNCTVNATELCNVTTSNGTCYCDIDCVDCCNDAVSASDLLLLLSQMIRMKELAQLMVSSRTYDWTNPRAENLRRRYQAGILARKESYYYTAERPAGHRH